MAKGEIAHPEVLNPLLQQMPFESIVAKGEIVHKEPILPICHNGFNSLQQLQFPLELF